MRTAFKFTPLISPERLAHEGASIFDGPLPSWVAGNFIVNTDADEDPAISNLSGGLFIAGAHKLKLQANVFCLAVLFEMTRFGHRVVGNSNGKRVPSVYAKMLFDGAPGDLVSVRRILFNATFFEITKPLWREGDYSPEDTRSEPHGHPNKDARGIAMEHVERYVRELEAAGKLPSAFDIPLYLGNIWRLFAEIDRLARPFREAAE